MTRDKPMPCCTSGFLAPAPGETWTPAKITWTTVDGAEPASDPLDGTTERFDACCSALLQVRGYINEVPYEDASPHDQETLELAWAMEKQLLTAIQRYCTALTE
jgi:hypothetical protein